MFRKLWERFKQWRHDRAYKKLVTQVGTSTLGILQKYATAPRVAEINNVRVNYRLLLKKYMKLCGHGIVGLHCAVDGYKFSEHEVSELQAIHNDLT